MTSTFLNYSFGHGSRLGNDFSSGVSEGKFSPFEEACKGYDLGQHCPERSWKVTHSQFQLLHFFLVLCSNEVTSFTSTSGLALKLALTQVMKPLQNPVKRTCQNPLPREEITKLTSNLVILLILTFCHFGSWVVPYIWVP